MKIALYQGLARLLEPERNLERMEEMAHAAALQGAGLVIFPELFLTGYNLGDDAARLAESAEGPSARRVGEIAARHKLAILYGYPEKEGARVYNSALLIDETGRAQANYRKTHLFGPDERRLFRPGDALAVARCGDLKVGILICYDIEFPELVRAVALEGADLIAVPTALSPPYYEIPTSIIRARAYENQVFVAYCNHVGQERGLAYIGSSALAGPDGKDLARAGERDETLLVATVDPGRYEESRRVNTYFEDRRPELYGAIAQPTHARPRRAARA